MQAIKWWFFFFVASFFHAMLMIIPLSEGSHWFRPQWIFMFVIFCQLQQPRYFNPIIAFCLGLLLDSLLGSPIGQNALVCTILSYITGLLRIPFFRRPLWSQLEKVFLLACLGQILILWFHAFSGQNPGTLLYWMSSMSSMLIWPIYVYFLNRTAYFFNALSVPVRHF